MIGCEIGTSSEAARFGEIVVIAVPLRSIEQLPFKPLSGKQIIDTVNYYVERDGHVVELDQKLTTTSELLARYLPDTQITKAFNAIPMTQLENDGLPKDDPKRRALPLAGNDSAGKKIATAFYDSFGFDAVDAGALSEGWRFERGMPSYCVRMTKAQLTASLGGANRAG